MSLHRQILPRILIIMFLVFFFESCARDEFKESCLESGEILKNAKKGLEISHVENISEDG